MSAHHYFLMFNTKAREFTAVWPAILMNHTCWIVKFGAYRSGCILHHFSVLNKQYDTADHTMSGFKIPGEGIGYPLQYSWASLVAQLVKDPPAMLETFVQSLVGKIPWRRERLPTLVFWPGEFHRLYSPWGRKEEDTTEWLSLHWLHELHCLHFIRVSWTVTIAFY